MLWKRERINTSSYCINTFIYFIYSILAMSRYFEVLFHLLGALLGAGVEEALSSRDKSLFFPLDTDEIGVKYEQRGLA